MKCQPTQTKQLSSRVAFLHPYTSVTFYAPAVTCLDVNTKWVLQIKFHGLCVVSGFRLDAYEICALLGIYAA